MNNEQLKHDALRYHEMPVPGKLTISSLKPCSTKEELSLAYTPGVAYPCLEIAANPHDAYRYTNKKNLVAVISNGTAVLGLGDIGAAASKPVMEGKGVLFKRFAGIDVYDIEINETDPEKLIAIVKSLEPTFGGINLEDIKAPECFHIEQTLKKEMNIPVFHDDQHGTAIIVGAGLLNALELNGKDIGTINVVFSGAGAAGTSCATFLTQLGVQQRNIFMFDKEGPLTAQRASTLTPEQARFAHNTYSSLTLAMADADVFIGVSVGGLVTPAMVTAMRKDPVVFALANPTPEIGYDEACACRSDIIMATGRSDYPNQINNVLGFPFLFRGALDVSASAITENMKIAASYALAKLAKEPVPAYVKDIYGANLSFGRDYIIPKPFDHRVLIEESAAVAQAAIDDGVAREIINMNEYRIKLTELARRLHT